tara:strand:- start:172 stop:384 length:213 start_codon:yes stop_codon:yes gene_type:complete
MICHTFADLVCDFRAVVAWSQQDLAEAVPINIRTLQRWEAGDIRAPAPAIKQRVLQIMRDQGYQTEKKAS